MVIQTFHAIADVARELGISETSRGNWVRVYRKKHAEYEPPLQLSERARLRELEREVRELRMKPIFLSKAAAYFAAISWRSIGERYVRVHRRGVRHLRERSGSYAHVRMAGGVKLPALAFYDSLTRPRRPRLHPREPGEAPSARRYAECISGQQD